MSMAEVMRKAMTAAYDLHRHADLASFPTCVARTLAGVIECDSAMLVTVDAKRGSYRLAAWPEGDWDRLDPARIYALHGEHPFVARCAQSCSVRAWRLSELAGRSAFLRTELYRSLYRFLGIEHQLLMLMASPDLTRRAVVLNRKGEDFSEDERVLLESFWPHLMLALRNLRRRLGRHDLASGEAAAEGRGIMVVAGDGDVMLCSEQARTWLQEYFDLLPLGRRMALPARLAEWFFARLEAERTGRRLRVARRDPLIFTRGQRCLSIDLIVDHGKDAHLLTFEEAALNAPADALESLGLTQREAQVLSWVAQGKTNREIGMILGASARTVQKHLEHIFQKLGVESRTSAILRAWQFGRYAALKAP